MNVSTLQQFLQTLMLPLEASAASAQTLAGLKRACQGFEPFRDKDVADFAEFLARAADYERDGKWPSSNPSITGRLVDEPSARDYADRLRAFLEREAPAGSPLSADVRTEVERLVKRLKTAQVKEMARELQIEESFTTAKKGIEKIVLHLTGQNLREKKRGASSRRKPAAPDPAEIHQYAGELRSLVGSVGLEQRLNELVAELTGPLLRALAESLGATGKARRKPEWNAILLSALTAPRTGPSAEPETPSTDNKVARFAEIVAALKAKADGPDAPHDEIEAELRSLEEQMDKDEAVAVALRIGVVRHLHTRHEAVEEIRRKVFEMKRARESVSY